LSNVQIPIQNDGNSELQWTTEFESSALEIVLLDHCATQYQKASAAQFGHGPMKELLGYNWISKAADQILEGILFENLDE